MQLTPSRRAAVRLASSLVVAALALLRAGGARACAVCAAGDPTLYAMGSEKTFEGRLRGALAFRTGEAWVGERGFDATTLHESRLDLEFVAVPWKDIALSADLPLLFRSLRVDGGGREGAIVLGDAELRARDVVWTSRTGWLVQSLAFHAGTRLPTSPLEDGPTGAPLPVDLQPGCPGAITPLAGLTYTLAKAPYALTLAATLYLPFGLRSDAPHEGDSIDTQATFQVQPKPWIAARLGFDTKIEEPGTVGPSDRVAPDSGGFVGYVAPELAIVPATDWVITAGAYFPAIQALRGQHGEGPIVSLSVTFDF